MRERLARLMAGRNGVDQLNNFLLALDILLAILASVIGGSLGRVLYAFVMGLLVLIYLRMFSRNLLRRRQENGKYLMLKQRFLGRFRLLKERWVQRRDYKFFTCPACHTTLRVPKGRGKIRIVCRKCGVSFTGKS
ncbi:MAG: hypothetical protein IJJ43_05610 [Oscillospiraceae bacterium]|nr:hypothetical protein [Oscillospiraceae bacterium]